MSVPKKTILSHEMSVSCHHEITTKNLWIISISRLDLIISYTDATVLSHYPVSRLTSALIGRRTGATLERSIVFKIIDFLGS